MLLELVSPAVCLVWWGTSEWCCVCVYVCTESIDRIALIQAGSIDIYSISSRVYTVGMTTEIQSPVWGREEWVPTCFVVKSPPASALPLRCLCVAFARCVALRCPALPCPALPCVPPNKSPQWGTRVAKLRREYIISTCWGCFSSGCFD